MRMWFEIYTDAKGEWRWSLKSRAFGNEYTLADSGEGYKNKGDMLRAIETIKEDASRAFIVSRGD